jgi:hypothetical protein
MQVVSMRYTSGVPGVLLSAVTYMRICHFRRSFSLKYFTPLTTLLLYSMSVQNLRARACAAVILLHSLYAPRREHVVILLRVR